jgi:Protein of unknown function (DUF3485)
MKKFSGGMLTAIAAFGVVVGTTYLHGRMTDRWTGQNVAAELQQAAELLEKRFPKHCGDWEVAEELDSSPEELKRAGAVGHISRSYVNARSKAQLSAFVVCATPHDASGHTPDRCYPGAGFEIAETEHRQTVPLADGRNAEVFTGTFRKGGQTLRVFWTYSLEDKWVAPQIARIELANARAVYKVYVIIDESTLPPGVGAKVCAEFLADVLTQFDAALKEPNPASPPGV